MTRRPVIAPGLHPLQHPSGHLQFGLSPVHRVAVPDLPAVRRTLAILDRGEVLPDTPEVRATRALIAPVLRDGDVLLRPGVDPAAVAALTLTHPGTAASRLDARGRTGIRVIGDLGPDADALIASVGLGGPTSDPDASTVVLLLSRGEPDREALDALVRQGIPHLIVRAVEAEIVVGPFVVPGRTACLQCCDLHSTTVDPAYGALLAAVLRQVRHDGVAEPVDTALAWIALGWAIGDLVRYAEGDPPTTFSAVVRLAAGQRTFAAEPVAAHPDCGCTWASGPEISPDQ